MQGPLENAGLFLIQTIFNLLLWVFLLRLILQFTNASAYNPLVQVLVKLTKPVLKPLRNIFTVRKGVDTAAVVVIFAIEVIKLLLLILLFAGHVSLSGFIAWFTGDLLKQSINIFFFAILLSAIFSWINSSQINAFAEITALIADPVLRPLRRIIPLVGGIDLSPIAALLILQLSIILLVQPLIMYGMSAVFNEFNILS